MLKCRQCGQYYIPGFLDCFCRTKTRSTRGTTHVISPPAQGQAALTTSLGAMKSTPTMPPARDSPQSPGTLVAH